MRSRAGSFPGSTKQRGTTRFWLEQRLVYLGRVAGGVGQNVLPEPAADGAVHAVRRHLLLHQNLPRNHAPIPNHIKIQHESGERADGSGQGKRGANGTMLLGRENHESCGAGRELPGIGEEEDALQHSAPFRGWVRRGGVRICWERLADVLEKNMQQLNEGDILRLPGAYHLV